jgi:hypothetical protein
MMSTKFGTVMPAGRTLRQLKNPGVAHTHSALTLNLPS